MDKRPSVWFRPNLNINEINQFNVNTMVESLDIVISEIGNDFLQATMPVTQKSIQPFKYLHGGASCALSESLASIAANLTIDNAKAFAVGQQINSYHIKAVSLGSRVTAEARPIHLGKRTQIWEVEIINPETGSLIHKSNVTMAIIEKGSQK